jgi:putative transposase
LDLAFQHFFRRLREGKTGKDLGSPKFKKFGCYHSFTYPDAYNGSVKLGSSFKKTKIYLSKIGYVLIRVNRSHPEQVKEREGKALFGLKTCTIKRENGKWFAVLVYETKDVLPKVVEVPKRPIGIDLGLTSLITTSDGMKIEPLKPLKKSLKRLAHLQRNLCRKKKGSQNRAKAQEKVSALHWRIGMQRRDALHKLTHDLALQYDLIVFEDLYVKGMLRNHSLARSLSDVSFSEVVRLTSYKAERYGRRVVLVSPNYTSTDCSSCGFRREMPLSVRIFSCEKCGLVIDRDWNSARTILERGLQQVGQVIVRTQACGEWSPVSSDTQPLVEAGSISSPDL